MAESRPKWRDEQTQSSEELQEYHAKRRESSVGSQETKRILSMDKPERNKAKIYELMRSIRKEADESLRPPSFSKKQEESLGTIGKGHFTYGGSGGRRLRQREFATEGNLEKYGWNRSPMETENSHYATQNTPDESFLKKEHFRNGSNPRELESFEEKREKIQRVYHHRRLNSSESEEEQRRNGRNTKKTERKNLNEYYKEAVRRSRSRSELRRSKERKMEENNPNDSKGGNSLSFSTRNQVENTQSSREFIEFSSIWNGSGPGETQRNELMQTRRAYKVSRSTSREKGPDETDRPPKWHFKETEHMSSALIKGEECRIHGTRVFGRRRMRSRESQSHQEQQLEDRIPFGRNQINHENHEHTTTPQNTPQKARKCMNNTPQRRTRTTSYSQWQKIRDDKETESQNHSDLVHLERKTDQSFPQKASECFFCHHRGTLTSSDQRTPEISLIEGTFQDDWKRESNDRSLRRERNSSRRKLEWNESPILLNNQQSRLSESHQQEREEESLCRRKTPLRADFEKNNQTKVNGKENREIYVRSPFKEKKNYESLRSSVTFGLRKAQKERIGSIERS